MAIRRGLSLHPDDRDSAVNGLDALLMEPDAFGGDYGRLPEPGRASTICWSANKAPEAVGEAQQRMWDLALHLEEGQTEQHRARAG